MSCLSLLYAMVAIQFWCRAAQLTGGAPILSSTTQRKNPMPLTSTTQSNHTLASIVQAFEQQLLDEIMRVDEPLTSKQLSVLNLQLDELKDKIKQRRQRHRKHQQTHSQNKSRTSTADARRPKITSSASAMMSRTTTVPPWFRGVHTDAKSRFTSSTHSEESTDHRHVAKSHLHRRPASTGRAGKRLQHSSQSDVRGVAVHACPSQTSIVQLRTAIDLYGAVVTVYQPPEFDDVVETSTGRVPKLPPGAGGKQLFHTVTCRNQTTSSEPPRDCPNCCLGIDHTRFSSSCQPKQTHVLAVVRKPGDDNYAWSWIRVDTSCGCAVTPLHGRQ